MTGKLEAPGIPFFSQPSTLGDPHTIPQMCGPPATHVQELQLLLHSALQHSHRLEEGRAHQVLCLLLSEGFPVQQLLLEGDEAEPGLGPVGASPQGLALPTAICLPPISEKPRGNPHGSGDGAPLRSACSVPHPCLTDSPRGVLISPILTD